MRYIVSYDLRNPGQDYEPLHTLLRRSFNGRRILDSVWIVRSSLMPMTILEAIRPVIDGNDGIVILPIQEELPGAAQNTIANIELP